ncbi:MAG: hypothetical protein A2172_00795 [Candidatus Woykebacteria bacterium RBG_13_40_15]|uniref:M23ase beta-sheet core domain-containing protein n=1 Tax=Candidatus Woykebacteria bacterium RBG_13_40_15 TaxID=1802593 RepID=A0A1G1W8R8_9BACT|nr:MAG: hypothetical protein A2172_00795 [Candidatus Woykebacteria bacterium RBG_13_40_15]
MPQEEEEQKQGPSLSDLTNIAQQARGSAAQEQLIKQVGTRAAIAIAGAGIGSFLGGLVLIASVVIMAVIIVVVLFGGGAGGAVGSAEAAVPITGGNNLVPGYCKLALGEEPPEEGEEDTCSAKLKSLFEAAGAWAKVPAGVLVGIAVIEGPHIFGYSDEEIDDYSKDVYTGSPNGINGEGIDPENREPNGCSAIGPMQMSVDYMEDYGFRPSDLDCGDVTDPPCAWCTYKTAVVEAGVTTYSPNPDVRNIRNAIYGAAWKLKCDSGAPSDECDRAQFTKYDYNDSDDAWEKEDEIEKAGTAYYGDCDKPIERFGSMTYCDKIWEVYLAVSDTGTGTPGGIGGNWPTSGQITQGPYNPSGTHYGDQASAVDINNDEGTPIFSTNGGLLLKDTDEYGGIYVAITGSSYITYYVHLKSYSSCIQSAENYTFVPEGEFLGLMGATGDTHGVNHLHYMIRDEENEVLPEQEFRNLLPNPSFNVGDEVSTSYKGVNCHP